MRLLALDSSGDRRSVALADGGAVVATRREDGARGHAERLVPLIDATLAESGWAWSAIDGLAVAVGPGSFTGVRIAVAATRALALALDRPVYAVTTLDALAGAAADAMDAAVAAAAEQGAIVPTIDARRGGLYVAWPERDGHGAPEVLAPPVAAEKAPAVFTAVGSGAAALVAAAGRGDAREQAVDAGAVAAAAFRAAARGAPARPGPTVRPLYVRAADAVPRAA